MFVNSPEKELPPAADFDVGLVYAPRRSAISLIPPDSFLQFRCVAMNLAHDRGRLNINTTFQHHLRQIAVGDPVLAVPATQTSMISTEKRRRLNMEGLLDQRAKQGLPKAYLSRKRRVEGILARRVLPSHEDLSFSTALNVCDSIRGPASDNGTSRTAALF